MSAISDFDVIAAMQAYGGSFVKALATAWLVADPINQAKLKLAFKDLFTEYQDLAQRAKEATK